MKLSRRKFAAGAAVSVLPFSGCSADYDVTIHNEREVEVTADIRVTSAEVLLDRTVTLEPDSFEYVEYTSEGGARQRLEVYVNVHGGPEKTAEPPDPHGTVNIEIGPDDIIITSSVE